MKKFFISLAAFFLIASQSQAMMVLQLNLEQLTALSEKVFVGRCVSVVSSRDAEGRPIQTVTYDVIDMLKGASARQVTFQQLDASDEALVTLDRRGTNDLFRDLPHYTVGEESVVFLSEAGVLGLTAPIGLKQGKFSVRTTESGKLVVNDQDNQGLFLGFSKSPRMKALALNAPEAQAVRSNSGAVTYDVFVSLVRKVVSSQKSL